MRKCVATNNSNNTDNANDTNNANNTNTTSPVARFIHATPLLFTNLRFHPRYLAHLLHDLRLTCHAQSRDANATTTTAATATTVATVAIAATANTARAMHGKQANRTTPV